MPAWFTGSSGLENNRRRIRGRHLDPSLRPGPGPVLTRWRKRCARAAAARARAAAYAADPQAGLKLAEHFPDEAWPAMHHVVAGYRAIRDEIDPAPLLETFALEQARLCLPCVIAPDAPLVSCPARSARRARTRRLRAGDRVE